MAPSGFDPASADVRFGHTELPCGAGPTAVKVCDPGLRVVEVRSVIDEPFEYASDGLSRVEAGAVTVVVAFEDGSGPRDETLHLAMVDGGYRIFSDCGTPLPGAP